MSDEQDKQEHKLLIKLQEAEEVIKDGRGWLSLDDLKSAMRSGFLTNDITGIFD